MTIFITEDEAVSRLKAAGLLGQGNMHDRSALPEVRVFRIPQRPDGRLAVARALADLIGDDSPVLLLVHDWGRDAIEEDWNLVHAFRRGLGEPSELWDKPGCLLGQEDYDDLVSLMALAFYFNWGLWVLSSNGKRAVYAHHDEIVWVLAATTESLDGETLGWLDALTEPF